MEKINLSESQLKVLMTLEQYDAPMSYEELATESGCSYDGVRGRVSELNKKGFNIQKLKEGSKTVLKYIKKPVSTKAYDEIGLRRPHTYGDMISKRLKGVEDFYGMTDFLNKTRALRPKIKKKAPIWNERCAVLVLSDWHMGSIVKENGKVVYNTEIAKERVRLLADSVIDKMSDNFTDDLYIAIIGDMVDGDMIYKNHAFYVEKPAVEQTQDVIQSLTELIRIFDSAGINITIGCVRGNHGITNYKNLQEDNWDNVVYDMLSLVFSDDENINIDHYQEDQAKVSVLDRSMVLYHGEKLGDQCKTSSGLKQFRGLCGKHKLVDGDLVLVGHLHTMGLETDQCKTLIRNGALTDASEYALRLNLYDSPSQTLLIIEEDVILPTIIPISV